MLGLGAPAIVLLLTACLPPPTFVFGVDSTDDRVDVAPGDGRCATAAPEVCTLRAAVMEANAQGVHTQVVLPPGTVHLTLGSGDENTGASDDLDVKVPLTVTGDPAAGSTIDGGGVGRVLDVIAGTTTLTQVTVTGGSTTGSGAGIQLRSGASLVASDVTISGNSSTSGTGGLKLVGGASADLTRVTVSGNSGAGNGGVVNAGTLTARNLTVSGNSSADGSGGGIATPAPGSSTLTFATITANSGSGLDGDGTVSLAGSIVSGQASGADCTGTPATSTGYNLVGSASCLAAPAAGDLVGGAAALGPLADNGGSTRTHRPGPASDATDAIPTGTAAVCDGSIVTDQRGRARPTFGGCDIGAVETGDLVVDRSTDAPDAAPGDGICEATIGAGDCTLRAAVGEANATPGLQQVVLLSDVTLSRLGEDNTNVNGDLDVTDALVVVGGGRTIDGGGHDRIFHATAPLTIERATITGGALSGPGSGAGVLATPDLTLRFVTVRGNIAAGGHGGGVAQSGGALVVEDSTITGNRITGANVAGGGIRTTGASATILRSTISANVVKSTTGGGGGISTSGGPMTVAFSTISGNRAGDSYLNFEGDGGYTDGAGGGGINGPVVLTASTVSGNWSGGDGGGLAGAPITIRSSTITGNQAVAHAWDGNLIWEADYGQGGAVLGTPTVVASTIAGNSASLEFDGISGGTVRGSIHTDSCGPTVTSGGRNVVASGCPLAGTGDLVSPVLPAVGALTDNGGPTATMLPVAEILGTIPAGTPGLCDASTPTDQRGRPRPSGAACDSGSVERSVVTSVLLLTDDPGDARDSTPGDGVCATATGGCTLRAAIDEANLSSAGDTIVLGVDTTLSRSGWGEDGNATGDLDIGTDLTIEGAGHVVDGGHIDRVLHHRSGNLTIHDLTLRRGSLHGADQAGGLVLSSSAGGLTITGSTLADGNAGSGGRGGGLLKTQGELALSASTITGTTAGTGAALALDGGTATLTHVTLAGAGPGTAVAGAGISASRSVIASAVGGACSTPFAASTWNLSTDPTCGPALVADPQLGALAANGGPTPTRLPAAGSPAINAIPVGEAGACDATAPADQRGVARPQGLGCDIGATESDDGSPPPAVVLTVDRTTDLHDAVPGDGSCAIAGGGCTLRAAVDEANAHPGAERIELTVDVTIALAGADDDANASGDFDVRSPLTIDGNGHEVDAAGLDRILDVYQPLEVTDVTISHGYIDQYPSAQGVGGGIRYWSDLVVRRSEVADNRVVQTDGGGISVARQWNETAPFPTLLIEDSTLTGNRSQSGSALVAGASPSAIVRRSTMSGNVGYAAIEGRINIVGSTVVDNEGTAALGYGVIDVRGSIVTSPAGSACPSFKPASLGYNVADASCAFAAMGDRTAASVPLGPLADNGGPTRTRLALAGSPSLDAIPIGTFELCDVGAVDQRGVGRPAGAACDIGATEGVAPAPPSEQVLVVNTGADLVDLVPGDGACLTSAGTCSLRAAIGEGNSRPGPAKIQLQTNVTLTRAGSGEDANATGDLDVTDTTRIEGADRTVDAGNLDRALHAVGSDLSLVRISIRGGNQFGGVRVDDGHLLLDRSTVSANTGTGVQAAWSTLAVRASTVSGNIALVGAGGIGVSSSTTTIERSTISGNHGPSGSGLGVQNGETWIARATFAANTGSATIMRTYDLSYVRMVATVVDGPAGACSIDIITDGWNVANDTSCRLTQPTDRQGVVVALGPLAANGGPTRTHLPVAGSPMVDRIGIGSAGVCDASTPIDQRGVARPAGAGCDPGAVEGTTAPVPGAEAPEAELPAPPTAAPDQDAPPPDAVSVDPPAAVVPDPNATAPAGGPPAA